MDAKQFAEHIAEWGKGRTFGSVEQMLRGIEAEAKSVISEGCIARFASVRDAHKGYFFVVGDGSPFCYLRVYTDGKKKLSIVNVKRSTKK